MAHLFRKLVAGALLGVLVTGVGLVLFSGDATDEPLRISQSDKPRALVIGRSELIFHFTGAGKEFELHVMAITDEELDDIVKTRVRLRDGQNFSLMLEDSSRIDGRDGDLVAFTRTGDSVVVQTKEAARETMIASLRWPFD